MRAKNDPWRYANELVALGVVVIVTSFAVTILAIARRASALRGDASLIPPSGGADFVGTATPEAVALVLSIAAFTGLLVFGAQVAKERRGAKRYACRLPCHVAFAGEDFRARLVNVSETGAQLKTKGYALREDDRLTLTVADIRIDASVVWTGQGRIGVKFARKLDYDAFRGILKRARDRGFLQRQAPPAPRDAAPSQEAPKEKAPAPETREPSLLRIEPTPVVRRPLS